MKGLQPCSCPAARRPLVPAPKCRALQSRGLNSVGRIRHSWQRRAAVSRPLPGPGPAPAGRWDELSRGECALLGAGGRAHRAHCRGGFGNDVMDGGVPRQALRAWDSQNPLFHGHGGFPQWGAFRCPMAVPVSGPRFRGQRGGGAWRAAVWSWRGARSLRTKRHSWKLAAVQRLNIHTPFFSPPLKRIWNN